MITSYFQVMGPMMGICQKGDFKHGWFPFAVLNVTHATPKREKMKRAPSTKSQLIDPAGVTSRAWGSGQCPTTAAKC